MSESNGVSFSFALTVSASIVQFY